MPAVGVQYSTTGKVQLRGQRMSPMVTPQVINCPILSSPVFMSCDLFVILPQRLAYMYKKCRLCQYQLCLLVLKEEMQCLCMGGLPGPFHPLLQVLLPKTPAWGFRGGEISFFCENHFILKANIRPADRDQSTWGEYFLQGAEVQDKVISSSFQCTVYWEVWTEFHCC